MTVYIPNNLDFTELMIENPIRLVSSKKGPKMDYFAFVVGIVSDGIFKASREFDNDDFSAPIWSELLKKFLGDSYKKYIDYLIASEVLFTNKQFFSGKSRRYSFTEKYKTSFKPYQITDKKLIRKVDTYYQKEKKLANKKLPFLYKWIKSGNLNIDVEGAESILPQKFNERLKERKGKKNKEANIELANIALSFWKWSIENIHSKKYVDSFSIGSKGGGRLYTSLANTSRSFRKFINFKGLTLCHVDVANSQPYFSSVLLNKEFWKTSMYSARQKERVEKKIGTKFENGNNCASLNNYIFKISPQIKDKFSYTDYVDIATLLESYETLAHKEFELFKKYVSSGQFYQKFAEEYNKVVNPLKQATKEDVKNWMFEVFFSENAPFILEAVERPQTIMFRNLFPVISQIFKIIKRNEYNTLALLLQNLESQAILHRICGLIAQKHPQIPIFTIHDSIVTTVGNEIIVEKIMQQELEKITGLPPTLRTKIWDDTYDE